MHARSATGESERARAIVVATAGTTGDRLADALGTASGEGYDLSLEDAAP